MQPSSPGRQVTHLADTSYLLCFGAVPRGLNFLNELFSGGIAAPPAVKQELVSLPKNPKKRRAVKQAAEAFYGRNAGVLLDAPLYDGDIHERDLALSCIATGTVPPPHDGKVPQAGEIVNEVTVGENAGESEAIAAAFRRSVPLLLTDGPATRHAEGRRLPTESAAQSIRRLAKTPKEKYQIYLVMERSVGNAGEPVPGHLWYREPKV